MGSKSPSQQTVTQKTQLPAWVKQAGKQEYNNIVDLTGSGNNFVNPFDDPNNPNAPGVLGGPWTGTGVAPQSADTQSAYGLVRNGYNSGASTLNNAVSTTQGAVQPGNIPQVNAGSFLTGNIDAYMSPYIQNVENAALDNMDRQRLQALNKTADAARSAGAFGGSRQGVMEGVTNAETARSMGELSANLRNQGFNTGAGLMTQDLNRALTAAQSNQGAAVDMSKTGVQAGIALGNLGMAQQQNALQGAAALQGSGSAQDAYAQSLLADRARLYELFRQSAFESPNIRQQYLTGTPYGQTTQATGPATVQGQNPFLTGLGGASTGLSIASSLNGAGAGLGAGGSLGLGGLGLLAGLFSDRQAKTDIEKLGKDPESGIDLYAYRYKNDPKTYPKVVGPMAQDVEKMHPGSTRKVGGKRVIRNLGFPGR